MADIIFRVVDLPPSVRATVSTSPDGCYNVYINARLDKKRQKKAADHEMRHIEGDHLFRTSDVAFDEAEADSRPQPPFHRQTAPDKKLPPYATLRTQRGYACHQVAKLVGISTGRYIRIEQGNTTPTPAEQKQIDQFFGKKD